METTTIELHHSDNIQNKIIIKAETILSSDMVYLSRLTSMGHEWFNDNYGFCGDIKRGSLLHLLEAKLLAQRCSTIGVYLISLSLR